MLDRERILSKVAELEGYLKELQALAPKSFEEFSQIVYQAVQMRLSDFDAFKREILKALEKAES